MLFFLCFCQKNTHKTHKIVKVAVINDNNNFAPSLFWSLCEFVGDCFRPLYFSSGAALPQKNTSVQYNHLRFHTMTSKKMVRSYYCLNRGVMLENPQDGGLVCCCYDNCVEAGLQNWVVRYVLGIIECLMFDLMHVTQDEITHTMVAAGKRLMTSITSDLVYCMNPAQDWGKLFYILCCRKTVVWDKHNFWNRIYFAVFKFIIKLQFGNGQLSFANNPGGYWFLILHVLIPIHLNNLAPTSQMIKFLLNVLWINKFQTVGLY